MDDSAIKSGNVQLVLVSGDPSPMPQHPGVQLPERCLRCGQSWDVVEHHCRGLCGTCRVAATRAGELELYPPLSFSSEVALELWEEARKRGVKQSELASALGLKLPSFQRTLARARRRRGE